MSANSYLTVVSGIETMIEATEVSSGVGNANQIVALNAYGQVDITMMPTGIGPDTQLIVSSENLAAGAFVNIYNVSGTPTVRNADNSNGRAAMGFVLASTVSPASALVYLTGINLELSGLIPGIRQYLGIVGAVTSTPPAVGSGDLLQYLGTATNATSVQFSEEDYIQL